MSRIIAQKPAEAAEAGAEPGSSAESLAYGWLKDRIRHGLLTPGARLRAEEIAESIGISRMPVREALRRLDSEGLVTLRPNRGAVVAGYAEEEILELFEIRAALEGLAARLAAPAIGEDQLDDLHSLIRRMGRVEAEAEKWILRHWEFHRYVLRLSGRKMLEREVERLHTILEPYLRLWLALGDKPVGAVEDHERLAAVLGRGDPDAAEAAMRAHVLETAPMIVDRIRPAIA